MASVDIQTKIIPRTTVVWRLFPGKHYKFLEHFQKQNAAFLDIPGFDLPDGEIEEAKDLAKRLRRAEVMIEKIRRDGRGTVPTITPSDLKNIRAGKKRQRLQQAVINLFSKASPGDLVVVPDMLKEGRILIGQFSGRTKKPIDAAVEPLYGEVTIPARRVTWLGYFPENKISTTLSKSLRNEYPFSVIERSLFLEVFSLAFKSYVYGDQHSATIYNDKDDFLDIETSLLGLISGYSARASQHVDEGNDEELDILDALFEPASIEYHCAIASDVHSAGFNRFTSAKFTPLVIAAMIACLSALAGCDSPDDLEKARAQIEIVNSGASPDDACTANVSKTTRLMLQSMDIDKLWLTCQNMKNAEKRAGLRSSAAGGR